MRTDIVFKRRIIMKRFSVVSNLDRVVREGMGKSLLFRNKTVDKNSEFMWLGEGHSRQ